MSDSIFDLTKIQANIVQLDTVNETITALANTGAVERFAIDITEDTVIRVTIFPDIITGKYKYFAIMTDHLGIPKAMDFDTLSKLNFSSLSALNKELEALRTECGVIEGTQEDLGNALRFFNDRLKTVEV